MTEKNNPWIDTTTPGLRVRDLDHMDRSNRRAAIDNPIDAATAKPRTNVALSAAYALPRARFDEMVRERDVEDIARLS